MDCDDDNDAVYPGAIEIQNNGIDEDCDGEDLIVSNKDLISAQIQVLPNPTSGRITVQLPAVGKIRPTIKRQNKQDADSTKGARPGGVRYIKSPRSSIYSFGKIRAGDLGKAHR